MMLCHFNFHHTEAKNILKSHLKLVPRCFHEIYFFKSSVQSNLVTWNFLFIAKLFANARLFTICEVNWQIGHRKWLTIAKGQLISKANCQALNSSKKRTNEFIFTTMRCVFVRCLEEIEDTKKKFQN